MKRKLYFIFSVILSALFLYMVFHYDVVYNARTIKLVGVGAFMVIFFLSAFIVGAGLIVYLETNKKHYKDDFLPIFTEEGIKIYLVMTILGILLIWYAVNKPVTDSYLLKKCIADMREVNMISTKKFPPRVKRCIKAYMKYTEIQKKKELDKLKQSYYELQSNKKEI